MERLNKHAVVIVAAIALPLLLLVGFQLFTVVEAQRREVERLTEARAQEIATLIDAQALADLKLTAVLASATSISHDDIPGAYQRAKDFKAVGDGWRTVRLSDPSAETELFDLTRPYGPARQISPSAAAAGRANLSGPAIGGVEPDRDGGYRVMIQAPVIREGKVRYVVTVVVDPASIQHVVESRFMDGSVGAVVDRSARFIARNKDYGRRLGQMSSRYVQEAVKRGGGGLYRGVTLEGFESYTAYATAPLTGWSAHIAVSSSLIDGPRRWSLIIGLAVGAACLLVSGTLVAIALRDMALRRVEDERLRQSQKMEAVGQLTGVIAHDFNNLLTAIIGGLDLVLRRSASDDPHRRYLEGALEAANRGAKLTSRLLAFARTQQLERTAVDVDVVIHGMLPLLDQSLGPRIKVTVAVDPTARWVSTDANQLELALLNLALNARDAMPDGGQLGLTTRAMVQDREAGHRLVEISVTDNGVGMERQVAERALDPFFTTKAVDKGTGLGLAQVYAVARQSGGDVKIDSTPGQGTTMRLLLPAAQPIAPEPQAPQSSQAYPGQALGGQTILVLDDDQSVREVMVQNLRTLGYAVYEAASGDEALGALVEIAPDLLVLDFLMPGLNGAEVAARARTLRPDQKMLVVSGYLDSGALDRLAPDIPILRKPFDGQKLGATVAKLLADEMSVRAG